MAKTKNFCDFMAISFVFWANISTGLGDPLGCSDLSQIFFGTSPTAKEWDKIVTEIIITTFVFLKHPELELGLGLTWQYLVNRNRHKRVFSRISKK